MKRWSLQTRLTVLLAAAVLVALGTAARIVDWRADSAMQQRFDASLLSRAQAIAAMTLDRNGHVEIDPQNAAEETFPGSSETTLYEVSCGRTIVARTPTLPPRLASTESPAFDDVQAGNHLLRVVALRFSPLVQGRRVAQAPDCEVRFAQSRRSLDSILYTLDFILIGCLLGACVAVILATPLLVRRGLRPLAMLGRAMSDIGPDAPGRRLPASGPSELVPLVARFNEVLARMDAGLARERQFAAGLAHEFRTRLAELRALVDVELRYPSGRDTASLLGELGMIGRELETTVTALLQLTAIESERERPAIEAVPVEPLVGRVCARQQEAVPERRVGIDLVAAADPDIVVMADPALLEIVLDNLVGNAVAYAPGDSVVRVHYDQGAFEVANRAPGLQAEDLANFGQRFWRKGDQGEGHAGLGLALAAAAARALRMPLSFDLQQGELRASLAWRRS